MSSASPAWLHEEQQANFTVDKKPPGVARALTAPGEIRLPRSTMRRTSGGWIKLLTAVTLAAGGFAFEGRLLRSGDTIPADDLPQPAVLLECAGTEGRGRGHCRGDTRYLVWKWDGRAKDWQELAQASSVGDEWAAALREVARRALQPEDAMTPIDCVASAERILSFVESELYGMAQPWRTRVLERLYGKIAGLIAA